MFLVFMWNMVINSYGNHWFQLWNIGIDCERNLNKRLKFICWWRARMYDKERREKCERKKNTRNIFSIVVLLRSFLFCYKGSKWFSYRIHLLIFFFSMLMRIAAAIISISEWNNIEKWRAVEIQKVLCPEQSFRMADGDGSSFLHRLWSISLWMGEFQTNVVNWNHL